MEEQLARAEVELLFSQEEGQRLKERLTAVESQRDRARLEMPETQEAVVRSNLSCRGTIKNGLPCTRLRNGPRTTRSGKASPGSSPAACRIFWPGISDR